MNELDLRVLQKQFEDAMYALAEAQAFMRAGNWQIEKHLRQQHDEKTDKSHARQG